eukprot:COSAG02_NODE_17863_length_975_cov_1.060502_1_plen_42_part_10
MLGGALLHSRRRYAVQFAGHPRLAVHCEDVLLAGSCAVLPRV